MDDQGHGSGRGEPSGDTPKTQGVSSVPFTTDEYLYLLHLASSLPALLFWTHGHGGDLQPLLMPVDASVLALH